VIPDTSSKNAMGQQMEVASQNDNFESSDSKIVSTMKNLLLKGYHKMFFS